MALSNLLSLAGIAATLLLASCQRPGELDFADPLVASTLHVNEEERDRLKSLEATGDVVVRPVALPTGQHLFSDNRHLGWPIGAKVGSTLLVAHHRKRFHHGEGSSQNEESSVAVVLRSTDGGETWSAPIDMRQFGVNAEPTVVNFGLSFGVIDDVVFLVSQYGVYRSGDEGLTWQLLDGALTQQQTGFRASGNPGPRIIIHPDRGLVIVMGVPEEPYLDLFSSPDLGQTWKHERVAVTNEVHPLEPTALFHDGHLIFVTRNHSLPFKWHQQMTEPEPPAMMVSSSGWFPMEHQTLTNISSFRWPDTSDLDYNPVTARYEAVVTNRSGGGPGSERNQDREQTVNLWSIAPDSLFAGRGQAWRFDGTLLRLKSGMRDIEPHDVDAAHPGGGVIDEVAGVQHIFIYSGLYETPTGIYRITRRLDTAELRRRLVGPVSSTR